MLKKTRLDWVKQLNGTDGYEWNPVENNSWNWNNYNDTFPATPSVIYIPSDIAAWKNTWLKDVLYKINLKQNHTFLIKSSEINIFDKIEFPANCWLGLEIESDKQLLQQEYLFNAMDMLILHQFFMVINLQESIFSYFLFKANYVVLDGNANTKTEWVQKIVDFCNKHSKLYFCCRGVYNKCKNKKNRIPDFFCTFVN